jgi:ribosomal protein L30E
MKKIFVTAAAILVGITAFAQMQFAKTSHDFGQVPEAGCEINYSFEFTNTCKTPVIITDVKSSCGCTTPEWTKQPVLAGKTGYVKAIFDPKDRPGIFDKEITVSTNTEQVKLKISGEVLPKTKGTADLYPRVIGALRLKSLNLPFANIYNTATPTDSLPVINTGSGNLSISFASVPAHITLAARPQTLKPNERGSIVCTYNAAKKNDWGYVTDKVKILLNGAESKGNEIVVSASIGEDFSKLSTAELANAPVAQFAQRSVEAGSVKVGESKAFSISVTNNGKSDLLLRKISSNCDCITLAANNAKSVKAGQTVELKATLSAKAKGKINKNISITTNAPRQANTVVRVSATVE